jgi:protein phosphatase
LFAVADGMGGHQAGEVASATAVEALRASVASGNPINEAIRQANLAVLEKALDDPALDGMGTTITALVAPAFGDTILIGHVGDSRAYLLRDQELSRLTADHSLVEELVREGRLTPEQAEVHPQRAIITRALGVDEEIDVDVYTVKARPSDRIVLCSDGLTTMVRDRDVERLARAGHDPGRTADEMVEAANEAGGEDNITVVVIDVVEVEPDVAPPDPEVLAEANARLTPTPVAPPDVEATRTEPEMVLPRRRRAIGWALLVVPLLAVLGVAVGGVWWYARQTYYVGLSDGEIVLYRGLPGGVLGWDPTVEARTRVRAAELSDTDRRDLEDGAGRGSRDRAERYLEALLARTTTTTTTTSSPTTSTTAVKRTPASVTSDPFGGSPTP